MESVYKPLPVGEITEEEEQTSRTYKLDLDAGRIVGIVDGIESVQQAILKALLTPRFKCQIYDNQYGSEIRDAIIADDASPEYIKTVIPGFVKDALKPDTRILDVHDFTFEFSRDEAYIAFTANTIFGETRMEVIV